MYTAAAVALLTAEVAGLVATHNRRVRVLILLWKRNHAHKVDA
jgi:hypothetical protein